MKSIVLYIIIILCFIQSLSSQNTFVKEFDLKNHSWDKVIGSYKNSSFLYIFCKSCNENCFSFAKLEKDSVTYYQEINISISNDPFINNLDTLIIFGDNSSNDIYSKLIYKQTLDGNLIFEKVWTDPQNQAIGIDHEGSILYKDHYVSIGSFYDRQKYEQGEYKTKGYISYINRDGTVDSFLVFDKYHSVRFRDVDIDKDGYLTIRADIIDTTLPDGYQDCIWIVKLDENRNVIWEWKSDGQLSTPNPGHIKCTQEGDILLQNYQKRRGPGFAQTVELLNENKEIEWKQFKPWSFNNRFIQNIVYNQSGINIIGSLSDRNIFPTFYNSKISEIDGKLNFDRRYINYHNKNIDIQKTPQAYSTQSSIYNIDFNKNLLIGSKQLNFDNFSVIKEEYDVILIQTDSFGCVDVDKCNDYYAWGDVPDSLYKYDQIDMRQKEWYYNIANNKGVMETKYLTFGQDSIIFDRLWGDRQYKEVLISDANKENTILDTLFVRWENTGKLFFIDKWIPNDGVVSPADSILYDFTLDVGDKFLLPHGFGFATVINTDSVPLFDGYKRKRITLKHDNNTNQNKFGNIIWIEGIGAENGLFYFNDWINQSYTSIDCYLDRGMKRWGNDENCKPVVALMDSSEFKIGDTWTYSHWIDGNCKERPIFQYSIVKDTLIENKVYSILAIKSENEFIEESKILLFKKDNKIQFYEKGVDYLLYDYTKKVGDTIDYFIPSNVEYYKPASFNDSGSPTPEQLIIIGIDSIQTSEGNWIKQFITDIPIPYPYENCNTMQTIYEGIGAANGLFGFGCFFVTTGCYGEIRCFISDNISLNLTNEECFPNGISIDSSKYKVGDRWLFSPHSLNCKEKIVSIDVVKDTLIEDKLCNIVGITKENNYFKESEVILFYKDSLVRFYEDGEFKIVYDFRNKNVGDTVEFYFPKQAPIYDISSSGGTFFPDTKSYKYNVVSKSTVIDDNGNVHSKYEVNLIYDEPCYDLAREIIEGVGSLSGIFGFACVQLPSGCPEYFRCFKGDQFNYNALNKDCELVATKDVGKQIFSIIPNPANDKIEIITDIHFDNINIYSTTGHKILIQRKDKMINISELVNGIYIIEMEREGQLIGMKKFVKIQ